MGHLVVTLLPSTHLRALSSTSTIPDLPNPPAASHTIIIAIL